MKIVSISPNGYNHRYSPTLILDAPVVMFQDGSPHTMRQTHLYGEVDILMFCNWGGHGN